MLKISEIFYSIQGESSFAGFPCTFVRLAGCNLRCRYCDTPYALLSTDGYDMSVENVVEEVENRFSSGSGIVEVTGGEPLLQGDCVELLHALLKRVKTVLLETNGTVDISVVPNGVIKIMDVKCPGSGEEARMLWKNLELLNKTDQVKFVITDRNDYDWSKEIIKNRQLLNQLEILFAPAYNFLDEATLAEWILADRLEVRLQVQLHRMIWPGRKRGV
jgi:7-carboxy-7-deazaguanine synthase